MELRKWRKERGLSQGELAARIGVHVNTLIRWESGDREPRASDIAKLCEVLGVSEAELLAGIQRTELTVNFYWEVDDLDAMSMKANEFSFGLRNDGMLLLGGALPWSMDVDDIMARLRAEIVAAKEGAITRKRVLNAIMQNDDEGTKNK